MAGTRITQTTRATILVAVLFAIAVSAAVAWGASDKRAGTKECGVMLHSGGCCRGAVTAASGPGSARLSCQRLCDGPPGSLSAGLPVRSARLLMPCRKFRAVIASPQTRTIGTASARKSQGPHVIRMRRTRRVFPGSDSVRK